jgi:hypothetical protein
MDNACAASTSEHLRQRHSRDLGLARAAFAVEDEQVSRQLSREAHGLLSGDALSPVSGSGGGYKEGFSLLSLSEAGHNEELAHRGATLVLRGAVDGLIVSVAALSLGDAGAWPAKMAVTVDVVLVVCWAAYSACREALENVTYERHYYRERRREAWGERSPLDIALSARPAFARHLPCALTLLVLPCSELDNFPEGEISEMIELYTRKGLPEPAARQVVTAMATAPDFFVDVMMLEELKMAPPPSVSALAAGARVCASTVVCGIVPPLGAMLAHRASQVADSAPLEPSTYALLLALTAVALGYLGVLRAAITHQAKTRLAMQYLGLALPTVVLARVAGGLLDQF